MASKARFTHLLQPIRDLACNWNIDIANDLEDYLEELEAVTISFDGGETSLNFAEAALLIQGTACIYSKKVEHFYNLVFNTLEFLSQQKDKMVRKASDEGDDEEEQEAELLLLDDIEESDNIDLADEHEHVQQQQAAVPEDDIRLDHSPLFLMNTFCPTDNSNGSFRMRSCAVHKSGALLLEESHRAILNLSLQPIQSHGSVAESSYNDAVEHDDVGMGGVSDDDDDIDAPEAGFDDLDDGSDDPTDFHEENNLDVSVAGTNMNEVSTPVQLRNIQSDPWATIEPHNGANETIRPFRKAKTFSVPKFSDAKESTTKASCEWSLRAVLASDDAGSAPSVPLKGVLHQAELGGALRQSQRRGRMAKAAARRTEILQQGGYAAYEIQSKSGFAAEDEQEQEFEDISEYDDVADDDDDDLNLDNLPISLDASEDQVTNGGMSEHSCSYEDLCRSHVEAYMKGADTYAHETHLSRRVSEWQERLEPVLQQQDAHPSFDIHDYGDRVINSIQHSHKAAADRSSSKKAPKASKEEASFASIVQGLPVYEACRLFLASLQLANNGNVQLKHIEDPEDSELSLELLSTHRVRVEAIGS